MSATGCILQTVEKALSGLWILVLTHFLYANRFPPPDQVRGQASLENALATDGTFTRIGA
jgi:hypothetical protein